MNIQKRYKNVDALVDILNRLLDTLESRREQISTRSTVSLAAASGLLVLVVQLIFDICEMKTFTHYGCVIFLLATSTIVSSFAIITSLDLIKRISRSKHVGKKQAASAENILFFGWIIKHSERELKHYLSELTFRKQIEIEIRQAISLSKNLEYRYAQLKKTYILFVIGLTLYIMSVIVFVSLKYNLIDKLLELGGRLCK